MNASPRSSRTRVSREMRRASSSASVTRALAPHSKAGPSGQALALYPIPERAYLEVDEGVSIAPGELLAKTARDIAGIKNIDELYDALAKHLQEDFNVASFSVALRPSASRVQHGHLAVVLRWLLA